MSENKKFCPNCGYNIKNFEGKFCPSCGFKINEDSQDDSLLEKIKISEENKEKIKEKTEEIAKITSEKSKIIGGKIAFFSKKFWIFLKEKIKIYFPIFLEFIKKHKIIFVIIIFLLIFYFFIFDKIKPYLSGKELKNNSGIIEETQTGKEEIEDEGVYAGEIENVSENAEEEINTYNGYFKVISEKAFFYDVAGKISEEKSYVMKGDIVTILGGDVFSTGYQNVCYYTKEGNDICGWIKEIDLKIATDEEIKKEEKRKDKISENIFQKNKNTDEDEENKKFLISHYNDIKNKNYYTAFHNYQYPKAKNVDDFAGWYKGVYEINLSEIEKIGKNEYRYVVSIYSDSGLNIIETSIKVGKVDGVLKILGYGTKKL